MSGAGNCPMRPSFKEHYAVINTALFDENACGRCLEVSCVDRSGLQCRANATTILVHVLGRCPDGDCDGVGDLRLSPTTFKALVAGKDESSITIKWRFLDYPVSTERSLAATASTPSPAASYSTNFTTFAPDIIPAANEAGGLPATPSSNVTHAPSNSLSPSPSHTSSAPLSTSRPSTSHEPSRDDGSAACIPRGSDDAGDAGTPYTLRPCNTDPAPTPPSPIPATHAPKPISAPTPSAKTPTVAPTSSPRTPQQSHQATTETTKTSSNTLVTTSSTVSSSSTLSQTGTTSDSDTKAATPAIPCLPIQPQSSEATTGGAEPQSTGERPDNDEAVVVTGTSNKATDFRATDESTTAAISPPASTPATVGEASPPSATLPSDTKASPRTPDPSDDEEKYTSSATGDTNGSTPRKQDSQTNGSGNGSSSRASDTASRGQLFWNPFFLLCASLLAIVGLVGSVVAYRAKQQRQMRHRMQQVAWHQHQARVRSLHRSTSSVSPGTRGDMYLVATTTRHGTPASATSTASPAQLATAPRTPFGIL